MTFQRWLVDTLERALTTLIEAAITFALAAPVIDSTFWKGLLVACVVAVVNVIKAAMTTWVPQPRDWRADMVVRALWTFVITALGTLASVEWLDLVSVTFWQGVVLAAFTASLAVVKAVLATRVSNTITPASLARAA